MSDQKLITVRVYLPPYLERAKLDDLGFIRIKAGSTLGDLFRLLRVPFPIGAVHLCRLNYEKADLKHKLEDGDTVSFFSLISGG